MSAAAPPPSQYVLAGRRPAAPAACGCAPGVGRDRHHGHPGQRRRQGQSAGPADRQHETLADASKGGATHELGHIRLGVRPGDTDERPRRAQGTDRLAQIAGGRGATLGEQQEGLVAPLQAARRARRQLTLGEGEHGHDIVEHRVGAAQGQPRAVAVAVHAHHDAEPAGAPGLYARHRVLEHEGAPGRR